jgi:hypothetical protein
MSLSCFFCPLGSMLHPLPYCFILVLTFLPSQSLLGSTLGSLGGNKQSGGSGGGLAGSVVSGLLSSGSGHSSGGGHGGSSGIGGKLASQLASNLFSGSKPSSQPQNYHGGQSGHSSGGGLGGLVGGVASMFGGSKPGSVGCSKIHTTNRNRANSFTGPEQLRLLQQRTERRLQRPSPADLVPAALAARPATRINLRRQRVLVLIPGPTPKLARPLHAILLQPAATTGPVATLRPAILRATCPPTQPVAIRPTPVRRWQQRRPLALPLATSVRLGRPPAAAFASSRVWWWLSLGESSSADAGP